MIEIYALKLTERLERPVESFLWLFPPERQGKIMSYRFSADRNRTLWAELLVRSVLAEKLSRPIEEIAIEQDERGKPYVFGGGWEISLSHSRNWAVCSIGEWPHGVDVEEDSASALMVARQFFTSQEYRAVESLDGQARARVFLQIWTIKESFVKLVGQGLDETFGQVDSRNLLAGNGRIAGRNFSAGNAVIGLCAPRGTLPQEVDIVPQDFFKRFG